ncbi:MAG: NAD(P)H-dependent oxidoreductase [Saprospiraceae bacterium]
MKILAFGASHSKTSINKRFAEYAAMELAGKDDKVNILDLNSFDVPLFTIDVEKEKGYPESVYAFFQVFSEADIIIISFAEHNGSYTASFKNLFDWASRIEPKIFQEKPTILLSTSSGSRGGLSVLTAAIDRMPRHGAKVLGHFALPFFYKNFEGDSLVNPEQKTAFGAFINEIQSKLAQL